MQVVMHNGCKMVAVVVVVVAAVVAVVVMQGGHKSGKPGIPMDFSEHGILREVCATSGTTDFALWVQPVSSSPYAAK